MNKLTKIFVLILCVALVGSLLVLAISANDKVAKVGDTEYATLNEALAAVATVGGEIELLDDADISSSVVIGRVGEAVAVTLKLGGHTLSVKGVNRALTLNSGATFNITGSGVLDTDNVPFAVNSGATLNITGGAGINGIIHNHNTAISSTAFSVKGGALNIKNVTANVQNSLDTDEAFIALSGDDSADMTSELTLTNYTATVKGQVTYALIGACDSPYVSIDKVFVNSSASVIALKQYTASVNVPLSSQEGKTDVISITDSILKSAGPGGYVILADSAMEVGVGANVSISANSKIITANVMFGLIEGKNLTVTVGAADGTDATELLYEDVSDSVGISHTVVNGNPGALTIYNGVKTNFPAKGHLINVGVNTPNGDIIYNPAATNGACYVVAEGEDNVFSTIDADFMTTVSGVVTPSTLVWNDTIGMYVVDKVKSMSGGGVVGYLYATKTATLTAVENIVRAKIDIKQGEFLVHENAAGDQYMRYEISMPEDKAHVNDDGTYILGSASTSDNTKNSAYISLGTGDTGLLFNTAERKHNLIVQDIDFAVEKGIVCNITSHVRYSTDSGVKYSGEQTAVGLTFDKDCKYTVASGTLLIDEADTTLEDGKWYHMTTVWSTEDYKFHLYLDGVEIAISKSTFALEDAPTELPEGVSTINRVYMTPAGFRFHGFLSTAGILQKAGAGVMMDAYVGRAFYEGEKYADITKVVGTAADKNAAAERVFSVNGKLFDTLEDASERATEIESYVSLMGDSKTPQTMKEVGALVTNGFDFALTTDSFGCDVIENYVTEGNAVYLFTDAYEDEKYLINAEWKLDAFGSAIQSKQVKPGHPLTYVGDENFGVFGNVDSQGNYSSVAGFRIHGEENDYKYITTEYWEEYKALYTTEANGGNVVLLMTPKLAFKEKVDFAVVDSYGKLINCGKGATAFVGCISSLKDGSTLTLFSDIDFSSPTATVPSTTALREINIDFNGYTIKSNSIEALISVGNNTTLNIYSSREGGMYYGYGTTAQNGISVSAKAFVLVKASKDCTINIGAYGEYPGSNLTIAAPTPVAVEGPSFATDSVMGNPSCESVSVHLMGGTYVRSTDSSHALITAPNYVKEYTVSDALIINPWSNVIFEANKACSKVTFLVENCVIINDGGQLMSAVEGAEAKLVLKDCVTSGSVGHRNAVTVLDGKTTFSAVAQNTSVYFNNENTQLSLGKNYARLGSAVFGKLNLTYPITAINADKTGLVKDAVLKIYPNGTANATGGYANIVLPTVAYSTFASDADKADVFWYDTNGNILLLETYIVGATPTEYRGAVTIPTGDLFTATFAGWDKPIEALDGDTEFYAQCDYEMIPEIMASMQNIQFTEGILINVYIPTEYEEYMTLLTKGEYKKVNVDGVQYYQFTKHVKTKDIDKELSVEVLYQDGNFRNVVTYSTSVYSYITDAFESDELSKKEKAMIYSAAAYIEAVCSHSIDDINETTDAIVALRNALRTDAAKAVKADGAEYATWSKDFANASDTIGLMSDKITSVAVEVQNTPRFVFTVADSYAGDVQISYTDIFGNSVTKVYTAADIDATGGKISVEMKAYDFAQTIKVSCGGSIGSYNLDAYCLSLISTPEARVYNLVASLYEYVKFAELCAK